jgi:hypothetical protein
VDDDGLGGVDEGASDQVATVVARVGLESTRYLSSTLTDYGVTLWHFSSTSAPSPP